MNYSTCLWLLWVYMHVYWKSWDKISVGCKQNFAHTVSTKDSCNILSRAIDIRILWLWTLWDANLQSTACQIAPNNRTFSIAKVWIVINCWNFWRQVWENVHIIKEMQLHVVCSGTKRIIPMSSYPSSLQNTCPSDDDQPLLQILPQTPLTHTSGIPSCSISPPDRRTAPSVHPSGSEHIYQYVCVYLQYTDT